MNRVKVLFEIVVLLTVIALVNLRLEIFNTENIFGTLFTGLSFFYLPGHIISMVLANKADSPDLWAMVMGYSAQGAVLFYLAKVIFIEGNDT